MNAPKPEPLVFPRGVRFPRKNEMPKGSEKAFERIAHANITTGFVRTDDEGKAFGTYFEANIHARNVFGVFCDLAVALLPDVAAPIIGLKDEKPFFGPYTVRDSAIETFEPYKELLQNDGFLEFGITFQHHGQFEEIFVKSSKYLQVWTNQPDIVVQIFDRNGIPPVSALEFIDEYPMVSESIDSKGNAAWVSTFETLKESFANLPGAILDQ